jgi:hypothetical protein
MHARYSPHPLDGITSEQLAQAQQDYVAALPRIVEHARVHFGHLKDPGTRDDRIASVVGIGWKHWLYAIRAGRDPNTFVSAIADYSVRHVRAGRRVDRMERPRDVFSPRAQRQHNFTTQTLPQQGETGLDDNATVDALRDTTFTPPGDQAGIGWLDFPAWLAQMSERDRGIVQALAREEGTGDVAKRFGVTPGAISQKRRTYHKDWQRMHGEDRGR